MPAQGNALGHTSKNMVSPEGAKQSGIFSLREIVQPRRGKSSPADHPNLPYIGLEHVEAHTTRLLGSVPAMEMKSTANSFQPGDVLYSRLRPYLNKVWRADREGLCSSEFIVMPGNERIDAAFLCYRLNSHDFVLFANSLNAGDRPRVDFDQISSFKTWLPSLPEQRRIVAEIEKQFTRLEAGVTALRRAQANLKRYRAAVLKAACEGKLVPTEAELRRSKAGGRKSEKPFESGADLLARILAERRKNWHGRGKYKEPATPDSEIQQKTPEGWKACSVGQVAECLDGKRVPINKAERAKRHGEVPYYGANGQVGWIDDYLFNEPLVLVVEDETFTGRSQAFSYVIRGKTWVNNHAHVLRATPAVSTAYLNYSLAHYPFTARTTGSTGRRKLTQKALMAAPYLLPPLAEQARIVAEVERRLSVVDELEAVALTNLRRAVRLRQSILQIALKGEI